jgi:hypothetical protein
LKIRTLAVMAALLSTAALATAALATAALATAATPASAAAAAAQPATATPAAAAAQPAATPQAGRAEAPPFKGTIHAVNAQLKASMIKNNVWRPGVPVNIGQLRLLKMTYWGFDKKAHIGYLMVNKLWARKLVGVFKKLYDARFPIRKMKLIDAYGASDAKSMAADNTSAFNGRYVSGTTNWSMHAYGLAIDLNPVENPYVASDHVSPANGAKYANRNLKAKGMVHSGDVVVRAFQSIGWGWGGTWTGTKDYQHFSSTGG